MSTVPDEFCSSCGKKLEFQRVIRDNKLICPGCIEKEMKTIGTGWECIRCRRINAPWNRYCDCASPTTNPVSASTWI